MQCCTQRKKGKINTWTFSHGTHVSAYTFEEALNKLDAEYDHNKYWASETHCGYWDVQLSDNIMFFDVSSNNLKDAVKKVHWKLHLDRISKSLKYTMNKFWKFKYGTCVITSYTLSDAIKKLENDDVFKNFWACETYKDLWDVQLSDNIVCFDVRADNVLEAVEKARWNVKLDKAFKILETRVYNEQ